MTPVERELRARARWLPLLITELETQAQTEPDFVTAIGLWREAQARKDVLGMTRVLLAAKPPTPSDFPEYAKEPTE